MDVNEALPALLVNSITLNRESLGSNPLGHRFEVWASSVSTRRHSSISCINEHMAIDSGGNVSELSSCSNCSVAEWFPGKSG